jgi:hypothetical protein
MLTGGGGLRAPLEQREKQSQLKKVEKQVKKRFLNIFAARRFHASNLQLI